MMDVARKWADRAVLELAGNPIWAWAVAAGVSAAVFLSLLALRRSLSRRLRARAEASQGRFVSVLADLIGGVWVLVLVFAGIYAGAAVLRLPPRIDALLRSTLVVLTIVQIALWASTLLRQWLQYRLSQQSDAARSTAVLMLSFGGRFVIWTLALLLSLDNLGVDVTALIAGLGVGGIAIALAVQNVLGDLFGSVAIALDKPFEVGDFIIVGDLMGTVEYIGLKTTRVRSLFGEQIVLANSDLLGSRIRNFKRMKERRVVFSLGVVYSTPPEKLEAIPEMIRRIVESQKDVRFDRAHFQKFGDFSLLFETVYYILSPDFNTYMDRQQAMNLAIYKQFSDEEIEFAYPTQTLHFKREAYPESP